MPYNDENPIHTWDFTDYEPEVFGDFWRTINALHPGSVIATGFFDDGLVYFEKQAKDGWVVVQVDNPNVEDAFPVGSLVTESVEIDAGGDIEVAYVIAEAPPEAPESDLDRARREGRL